MSTLKVNSIEPANAGSEDYFLARAWVNFDGTGTVAIRADGNVSSLTDNATGDYTINFSAALTDANYAISGSGSTSVNFVGVSISLSTTQTNSSCRVFTGNASAKVDTTYISAAFLR